MQPQVPLIDDSTLAEVRRRIAPSPPLAALVLVGSAARNEMRAHSDIDVNAFFAGASPWMQPVRDGGRDVFFNREGRQVELAYMSFDYARRRMLEEAAAGRRTRLDWAEEGVLLEGGSEEFHALRREALELLAKGPAELVGYDRGWEIFDAWNRLKDVIDCADDEALCALMASAAFQQLVRLFFRMAQVWEPRPRAALGAIAEVSPACFELAQAFLGAHTCAGRIERLQTMARWLAVTFYFDYEAPYHSRPPGDGD